MAIDSDTRAGEQQAAEAARTERQNEQQQQQQHQQEAANEFFCGNPEEKCQASDHFTKFDPMKYLESFYKTAGEDLAMQVVLAFLPAQLARLPKQIRTMLDLGAGPTIYLPVACRERVGRIYTSDYAPANREALIGWAEKRNPFDWDKVCRWIAALEGTLETSESMQKVARDKLQAVMAVNVHESEVIRNVEWKKSEEVEVPSQFQLVSTIFCLEYSGETLQEYLRAVKGACSLIETGGYLLQGGVLDADSYSFGGKRFSSHRLCYDHIIMSLKENGMCHDENSADFKFLTHDDIYLFISKKLE